jgi:hydrogenase-4 transcriptional activator
MEKFKEIILDVWKEACRHIQIAESVPLISHLLIRHLPLNQLLIRRIDLVQFSIDTIAAGFLEAEDSRALGLKKCSETQINELSIWHGKHKILQHGSSKDGDKLLRQLFPFDTESDIVAGPLGKQSDALPVLVLLSNPGQLFEPRHIKMTQMLLEPFTVALENNLLLRQLEKLKEAAEADNKSLLLKLHRKDIDDTIIGADTGLKNVMKRIQLVANLDLPVLIFGETGTGKELIARNIHKRSNRSDGPFIRVNCGAIPSELIDSQLFGHEKGSFTGAVDSRKGWFERANGGTLFLDEVGEMSLKAQIRLLRILQDGWMERVGGKKSILVDVRIVLATNQNLSSMVAEGKFREDLWYRISSFPIFLPPLRERFEDLKALSEHFSKRSAHRFGLPVTLPTENDLHLLIAYEWPGNIRELATVIDRAALLGNGRCLEIAKSLGWENAFDRQEENIQKPEFEDSGHGKIYPLDVYTTRYIEKILVHTRGKIEGTHGAASLLKINPHTLRGRMRKLGINWSKYRY